MSRRTDVTQIFDQKKIIPRTTSFDSVDMSDDELIPEQKTVNPRTTSFSSVDMSNDETTKFDQTTVNPRTTSFSSVDMSDDESIDTSNDDKTVVLELFDQDLENDNENPYFTQISPNDTGDLDFNFLPIQSVEHDVLEDEVETVIVDITDAIQTVEPAAVELRRSSRLAKLKEEQERLRKEREEQERLKKEQEARDSLQKTQSQVKSRTTQPFDFVAFRQSSSPTIAREIIVKNVRLEAFSPDGQAAAIFKGELASKTQRTSRCSLCGFMFGDRVSYIHNKRFKRKLDKLTISYDHFIPINFAAIVFRIPISKGKYTGDELQTFRLTGDMACYHCNYEKSQRMFITCPKDGQKVVFTNFEPKEQSIKEFVDNLVTSTNRHGLASNEKDTTLKQCIQKEYKGDVNKWKESRIAAITKKAQLICNKINTSIDFEAVQMRLARVREIINQAEEDLKNDKKYTDRAGNPARQLRYRKEYIARQFGMKELTFEKPWKLKAGLRKRRRSYHNRKYKNKRKTYRRIRLF
jgi:hypothetical protein